MSPAVLARLGVPFFTTKEPGQGMGLGVFVAESVVRGLGGRLEFASRPGEGTRVRVRLPWGELLRDLKSLDPVIEVLVLTGYGSIATAVEAVRLGATGYLPKPADADDILAAFERAQREPLEPTRHHYRAPSLARAEWEHIQRVLADCGGNVSEAARRLGIHRRTLQRKLQKYPPKR